MTIKRLLPVTAIGVAAGLTAGALAVTQSRQDEQDWWNFGEQEQRAAQQDETTERIQRDDHGLYHVKYDWETEEAWFDEWYGDADEDWDFFN